MYDKLKTVYATFGISSEHFHKVFAKAQCTPYEQEKIRAFMTVEEHVTEWELWGREHMYELTEAGKRFNQKLQHFRSLDLILAEIDKRKNISTPTFKQICEFVSVPFEETLYEYLEDDGFVKEIPSKDVDKSYQIKPDGTKWLRSGGYVSWIDGRVNTVYRQQKKTVSFEEPEHLHERILYFLEEKSKQQFGEYQCLSDEFPEVQFKVLNSITQQLKVKQQVEAKLTGPLTMSFHNLGADSRRNREWPNDGLQSPQPAPKTPSKIHAFITLEGIAEVKRLKHNHPSIPSVPVQNTYHDYSHYVDQSVKVNAETVTSVASNVDTLTIETKPEAPLEQKNMFVKFVKKFWGWIVTIIVGVLAKLIIDYLA